MSSEQTKPQPGWSDKVNDPEVLAGLAKVRRTARLFGAVMVAIAFAAPPVVAMFSEKLAMGDAVKIGAVIAGAIIVCSLFSKISCSLKKPYEATVVAKEETDRIRKGEDKPRRHEYITVVRLENGKTKKIVETSAWKNSAWKYLKVGDRFRYHPQLNYPYELYDRANAGCLFCGVCSKENPVEADRCAKCNAPLIK